MAVEKYTLPTLPYALDALSPSISAQIMDLHYNRHHATYVTNLNALLTQTAAALRSQNLPAQLALQPLLAFHAGGHVNHTLFWAALTPPGSADADRLARAPGLSGAIAKRWGGEAEDGGVQAGFRQVFADAALGIRGSGWAWLVRDAEDRDRLEVVVSRDQELPEGVAAGAKGVVLGLDMWEHAYYLQYWNDKKDYVGKWWDVVNWRVAEERWRAEDVGEVFAGLGGLVGRL